MRPQLAGNSLRKFASSFVLWFVALWMSGALPNVAADANAEYAWRLPPGFPKPAVPPDNPMSMAKVQLGCRLFFDTRLSITGTVACASCHQPELAFSDGRVTPIGATGDGVRRNAMSLTNVAYNPAYTWASTQITTLETQMERPLFGTHPIEMGLQNDNGYLAKVATDYASDFRIAFPGDSEPLSTRNVVKAIAAYERTLISGRSVFDRYVFDDERGALSAAAQRGMTLFYSRRSGCAECHSGFNFSGPLVHERANAAAQFANTGLYNIDGHGSYPDSDAGLFDESNALRDMGRFRVATLRNIALTAPYMHDGSIATLSEVVDHYNGGGKGASPSATSSSDNTPANTLKDAKIRPLSLTADERDDLIAFLESLTDREFAAAEQRECSRIVAP